MRNWSESKAIETNKIHNFIRFFSYERMSDNTSIASLPHSHVVVEFIEGIIKDLLRARIFSSFFLLCFSKYILLSVPRANLFSDAGYKVRAGSK